MKRSHVLTQTRSLARPWRVIFFDTETKQTRIGDDTVYHELRLGSARVLTRRWRGGWDISDHRPIRSQADFWDWVDRLVLSKKATYLVAHNLVFDLSVMGAFPALAERGWELKSFYSKGMVSIFRWSRDKDRLIGLDNGNFFSGKLERWGKEIGLPKLTIDLNDCTDDELMVYCQRDVDIMLELWRVWLRFLDENDCGSFKPTVASTAFNTWRHRYMTDKVHIHTDEQATALERVAYRGGRTECLYVGELDQGPYYYLDVNNMYGYVMDRFEYPAGIWGYSDVSDPYRLAYKLARYAVIARVVVNTDRPAFPVMHGPYACYPVGEFETVLTTPELKYAIDHGWIVNVSEIVWYRKARIFTDYVRGFVSLRRSYEDQGHTGYVEICKLLVNALYGKFGQLGFHQEIVGTCPPHVVKSEEVYDETTGEYYWQTWLGGRIYREWREGESYHSFPGIAAHVTAYARLYLYRLAQSVPVGHVFYMDTDSLIVDQVGYNALRYYVHPDQMGSLKVERQSDWLGIYAPKDYIMEGRVRRKGISGDAVQIGDHEYRQTQWPKLRGLIQAEISQGYITRSVNKDLKRVIHSGLLLSSGWVAPYDLPRSPPPAHTV